MNGPIEKSYLPETAYPDYAEAYEIRRTFTIRRLLVFLSIIAAVICLLVNLFTLGEEIQLWSLIVIAAVICGWSFLKAIRSQKLLPGGKILICYVTVTALLIVIDASTGWHKWSTSYLVPFLTIAIVVLTTVFALTYKPGYKYYLGYLLATLFISICPLLLFLFNLSTVMWTSIVALAYALLTALGFYIFSPHSFKEEMKKKFYY